MTDLDLELFEEEVPYEDLGPKYSKNDLLEIEEGQGVIVLDGDTEPYVILSESATPKTQEDTALALWALYDPHVRAMFRKSLVKGC
jgi:hypothetical protein